MPAPAFGDVFAALLDLCPPAPPFPPPWDFVPPPPDARGAAGPAALAALRAAFGDAPLVAAGVARPATAGGLELAPAVAAPGGVLAPLAAGPGRPPFALLTPRGGLPPGALPARAALRDRWTARRAGRLGVLFAAGRAREALLLRALGLPATLSAGLGGLGPRGLRGLDRAFAGEGPAGGGPPGPALALLGWSPLALAPGADGAVTYAAGRLAAARRFLGVGLAGVGVWRPGAAEREAVRYAAAARDPRAARAALAGAADALDDFDAIGPAAAAAYPAARAELVAALADAAAGGGGGGLPDRARRARAAFDAAVERDLVGPLEAWAAGAADPAVRAAGAELATAAGLVHRMGPLLAALFDRGYEAALEAGAGPLPDRALRQYLALAGRFGGLLRDLARLRGAG